jgi:hypothetical protein
LGVEPRVKVNSESEAHLPQENWKQTQLLPAPVQFRCHLLH